MRHLVGHALEEDGGGGHFAGGGVKAVGQVPAVREVQAWNKIRSACKVNFKSMWNIIILNSKYSVLD